MSTEEPQSQDENPGEDATTAVEKPAYREFGERLLEDEPDLTAPGFAGRLFDAFDMAPDPALELYGKLTDNDPAEHMTTDESGANDDPNPDSDDQSDHQTIATRFIEGGVATDRFVEVDDGDKACYNHDTRYSDPRQVPGQNYGVYADASGPLVVLDIDDYRDSDHVQNGLKALFDLPPTLEACSPHGGTHKFYVVEGAGGQSIAEVLDAKIGTQNPEPSWGEVQVAGKYVVGAGSQLDGCSKEWCNECAAPDGGRYEVQTDQPIATVSAEKIARVLAADDELGRDSDSEPPTGADEGGAPQQDRPESRVKSSSTPNEFDEWLDEEFASEALDHVDPDVNYPVWRNIGFALAERFSTGTAKRLFKNWSQDGTKWDSDAKKQADRIIDDAGSGDVTPATLVYHAKQGGWEPPAGAPSIDELLDEHSGGDEPIPFWLVRQAAVEFGVCDQADLVEQETDDGETYLGFDAPTYNAVLRALDDDGVDHGREPIDTETRSEYYDADLAAYVDDGDPWTDPDTMLRAALRARDDGAVSEHAAPPKLALLPLRRDVLEQPPSRDMSSGTKALLEDLFHELTVDELDAVLNAGGDV